LLKNGINFGCAREIGPGYLGLEWLKHTSGTSLKGLDISPDMIGLARRNADEYGLSDRIEYCQSSGDHLPFDTDAFDAMFSNGSLHEWADPRRAFHEIGRVLKPGGLVFISDLRRDMSVLARWFLWINTKPKAIRQGLVSSINVAYTPGDLRELIRRTPLEKCRITIKPIGLTLAGILKDGKYTAESPGWTGMTVEVRVTGGKIREIKVLRSKGSERFYKPVLQDLPPQIVAKGSPEVDGVKGATLSSTALKVEVRMALEKAKRDDT
jgi:SAM-dependent methyltransferase